MSTKEDTKTFVLGDSTVEVYTRVREYPTTTVPPIVQPGPTPKPVSGNIGPDGVEMIYPSLNGGTSWFINNSLSDPQQDPCFSLDGINSKVSLKKEVVNGVIWYTGKSSPVNYRSGGNGSTLRFGIYASKDSKGQKQKHVWSEKPDFIYDDKGIRNHELTCYVLAKGQIGAGKHMSLACKVCGGKEDLGRSLVETCYPISQSDHVRANYNYEHSPYIGVKGVKEYFSGDWLRDGIPVGIKHIHIVAPDKSFTTNYLYVSLNPFDTNGKPTNDWKLKGMWVDKGTSGYNNIVCNWRAQVDKIRVDGYGEVSIALMSVREIDPTVTPKVGHLAELKTPTLEYDSPDPTDDQIDVESIADSDITGSDKGLLDKLKDNVKKVI